MFEQISTTYTGQDASIEIVIMLVVAFGLGFLCRFFIGQEGMKRKEKALEQSDREKSESRLSLLRAQRKIRFLEEKAIQMEQDRDLIPEEKTLSILKHSI